MVLYARLTRVHEPESTIDFDSGPPLPISREGSVDLSTGVSSDVPLGDSIAPTVASEATTVNALPPVCPQCASVRADAFDYCTDCGYIFPASGLSGDLPAESLPLVGGRYQLGRLLWERGPVTRYLGTDIGAGEAIPVVIVRQKGTSPAPKDETQEIETPKPDAVSPDATHLATGPETHDFELPEFEVEEPTDELPGFQDPLPAWPSTGWEHLMLVKGSHLSLPRMNDAFQEHGDSYLIQEVPVGVSLWDAWEKPDVTWDERFGWMIQIVEALRRLHQAGAILECLTPDKIVVSSTGQAILTDLNDLLPLPLPADLPLRGEFSTAPELLLAPDDVDERADLYCFGALLHALVMGRELSELDFTLAGMPRAFLDRMPDADPYLGRVLSKTFVRELDRRFPTEDGHFSDPTGFKELVDALEACRRNMDRVRLDIAAWSNTGMLRTGNEDAVALLHGSESRLDDADEFAAVILADGMGGMESGEVAAALCVQVLRQRIMTSPPFSGLLSRPPSAPPLRIDAPVNLPNRTMFDDPFATEISNARTQVLPPSRVPAEGLMLRPADRTSPARSVEAYRERAIEALNDANRHVYEASRVGYGGRGMGCTAELLLIDGRKAVIGHVGDSRTYHIRRGKLTQITRDQTLVNRLVELGQLTKEEAEYHPRRAELQQAIGGRVDVIPDTYDLLLQPGDWLVVCSDGLTNQLHDETISLIVRECRTAEQVARRLVNLTILDGAIDNVTVAVVRVC
jgi:PPM family protein phosphatase